MSIVNVRSHKQLTWETILEKEIKKLKDEIYIKKKDENEKKEQTNRKI